MASERPLTAADKRKATRAANAAKEIEENIAFQNESRANGGRAAKKLAKSIAIWNIDRPSGWSEEVRKRTSSTAEATDVPAKKAKEMKAACSKGIIDDSDDSMSDAPPRLRRITNTDDDLDLDVQHPVEDMQPRSRKSSASSAMSATSAFARIHVDTDTDDRDHERRSRRSSTGSGHSGRHSVAGMELDNDESLEVDAAPKKKKTKKVSAARQKQADAEKPEIKSEAVADAVDNASVDAATVTPESEWHASTHLVFPAPGKDIALLAQRAEVQSVLRGASTLMKDDVCFVDAYPRVGQRGGFARPKLLEAAAPLPEAVHIYERLMLDKQYAVFLAPIPIDRAILLRGGMKRSAVNCVMGYYELTGLTPDKVMKRVEELLKDHRYIFPSSLEIKGRLLLDQPFCHGAISHIIKEELFSTASYVEEHATLFPTGKKSRAAERELPDSMVALAATAVYAALMEFRNTGRKQNIPFKEDAYEGTYRNHMKTLKDSRKDAPGAVHAVLHQLYKEVAESDQIVHTASGSSATLIQLVDIPDSD